MLRVLLWRIPNPSTEFPANLLCCFCVIFLTNKQTGVKTWPLTLAAVTMDTHRWIAFIWIYSSLIGCPNFLTMPPSQTVSVPSLIFSPLSFFSLSTSVLELPPHWLSVTPDTRQMFSGEHFSLQCPTSQTNSSGWKLLHFSRDLKAGTSNPTVHYSPPGGSVSKSEAFVFTAASVTGGLYWCEGAEGRSNAVNITVSCESCVTEKFQDKPRKKPPASAG